MSVFRILYIPQESGKEEAFSVLHHAVLCTALQMCTVGLKGRFARQGTTRSILNLNSEDKAKVALSLLGRGRKERVEASKGLLWSKVLKE